MAMDGRLRGPTPKNVARELLRGSYRATSILAGAVIVQVTALIWLMISLARDTDIDFSTIPAVSWCIGFALLATAVAMAAARLLLGRHLSALMTVVVLAGWSLLPGMLILFPVSLYGGPILMLLAVTPMFLALLAFTAIAAGSRVTGAIALIAPMMLVAAICYARPAAPGNPAWFVVAGWFTALAAAALAAVVWHPKHLAPTQTRARAGYGDAP
jgi:hypothetical protein